MATVQVIQRNAHLAAAVRLEFVQGREGPIAKAVLTAISNTRRVHRGSGEAREEAATAIQWTLWGKQAEYAAEYLGKGAHVNILGRLRNNNYERGSETVYTMAFTAEEIDYLDSRAEGEARRLREEDSDPRVVPAAQSPSPHTPRTPRTPREPRHARLPESAGT